MELMDRELQRQLLAGLAAAYPATVDPMELGLNSDDPRWTFNAMYLAEHDLVDAQVVRDLTAGDVIARARITAKGLDFLQDDGGLGAILNTVTVRFEVVDLALVGGAHVSEALHRGPRSRRDGLAADVEQRALGRCDAELHGATSHAETVCHRRQRARLLALGRHEPERPARRSSAGRCRQRCREPRATRRACHAASERDANRRATVIGSPSRSSPNACACHTDAAAPESQRVRYPPRR